MYVYVFVVNPLADYKSCPKRIYLYKTQVVHMYAGLLGRNVVLHMPAIRGFAFLCVFIHLTILLKYITVA